MKFILEINNSTKQKFSKKSFLEIFKRTVGVSGIDCLKNKELELSIAIVDEVEIGKLNKQYRQKNSATDVLSFCEYEKTQDLCAQNPPTEKGRVFLGELIICPDYVRKNAIEDGETFEYALSYITAHGILHLLGFAHGKKMFALQKQVADEIATSNR